MPITILGPNWSSVRALQASCEAVPETGTWQIGGRKLNAIEQLTRLQQAGIRVPEFTTDREVAINWEVQDDSRVVLGRALYHTHGSDILPYGHRRWAESDWWSVWVPSIQEWRIHVLRGRAIARGLKVQVGPARRYHRDLPPIRSRRDGWHMIHNVEPPQQVRDVAKAAVAALGYDHGAVDILNCRVVLPDEPLDLVVLEVNLVPGMDPYTVGQYTSALRRLAARGKL